MSRPGERESGDSGQEPGRMIFVANNVYGPHVGGGEVHFFHMARAAAAAGLRPVYVGGHALGAHLRAQGIRGTWWPTDRAELKLVPGEQARLSGQLRLFGAYLHKYRRTRQLLTERGRAADRFYAISDFWFDLLPVAGAGPGRKAMMLQMLAPRWPDLLLGRRPDARAGFCAALHYRLSQSAALRGFRRCDNRRVFYVHPDMAGAMRQWGFADRDLLYLTNGIDRAAIEAVGEPGRVFDLAWIGRLHRQKGLDHLAEAIGRLHARIEGFRAVVMGDVEPYLRARLAPAAAAAVTFTGVITGPDRFRLLKSARVLLMPSLYESWGIVVAEALACRTPVAAYDLPAYRAVFGDLLIRVPCFDCAALIEAARDAIVRMRSDATFLDEEQVRAFVAAHDWEDLGRRFVEAWNKP